MVGTTSTSAKNGVLAATVTKAAAPADQPVGNGVFGFSRVPNASGVFGLNDNGGNGVAGNSPTGNGVAGFSDSSSGVFGHSINKIGVFGVSDKDTGVFGKGLKYAGFFDMAR